MRNASLMFLCCILFIIILPEIIRKSNDILPQHKQNNEQHLLNILDVENNTIIRLPLEDYAWRVAAKEMPTTFQDEALKAQIVLARTFALKRKSSASHDTGIDVCTDHTHCTAFLLPDTEKSVFGNNYKKICNRLSTLTKDTHNQILTYDHQPILAVFHAISSGTTEKSSDIWSSQLPYLVNVDSSIDEKADGFYSEKSFTEEELKHIFNINYTPEFKDIVLTTAGSVKTIKISDKTYTGTQIRNLLNLRSNNFRVQKKNDIYFFYVKGYGHGVGMSQTGANELAKKGLNFKDILHKYYPGTSINLLNNT